MSFRRAIRGGRGDFLGEQSNDSSYVYRYGLDADKIEERARWLDDYRFQMVRHGGGQATLETYEAWWDPQARPFDLTHRGAKRWEHPSGKVVVGAWRVRLIARELYVSDVHQDIAARILERELGDHRD